LILPFVIPVEDALQGTKAGIQIFFLDAVLQRHDEDSVIPAQAGI
jgi:hypothetical protein